MDSVLVSKVFSMGRQYYTCSLNSVWNTLPRKSSSVDIEAKDYEPSPNTKRKRNAFGSLKQNRSQDDLTSVNKGLKAHKEVRMFLSTCMD